MNVKTITPEEAAAFDPKDPAVRLILGAVPYRRQFFGLFDASGIMRSRIGAALSYEKAGTIGFLRGDLTRPAPLLNSAEAWLKSVGAARAIGPMQYNTWFTYRIRIDETDGPSFGWEPEASSGVEHTRSVALAFAGYQVVENYSSKGLSGLGHFVELVSPDLSRATENGFVLKSFTELMADEAGRKSLLSALYRLSMEAFQEAFLFTPISEELFTALYVSGLSLIRDLSFSSVAFSASGEPAAFTFAFPDQGYVVIKTVAVDRKFRGQRLANATMAFAAERANKQGLDKMVHAMMRSDNVSQSWGAKASLLWEHRYALFAKDL